MTLELGVLAAVWLILNLSLPMVGAFAAVIVAHNLVPERWSGLVLGVSLLGVAVFFWAYFGWQRLPLVIGIFGVLALLAGAVALRRAPTA